MNEVPVLVTRKPTGKPPWPLTLLAGCEKSGKSWAAAEFSASDMVGKTYFVEIGEHYADEYGSLPGVRYKIAPHDGTYRGIGYAIWAATKQPREESGKPNCIIVDSLSVLWEMLSKQAHRTAYNRWRNKHPNAPEPAEEVQVTMDIWNTAKDKFGDIINLLRQHDGPVIVTSRLEEVTVMAGGKPTTEKKWKVQAEKNLAYEVDAVIQARTPRVFEITGLRSTKFQLQPGETIPMPGFTVEGFMRKLGLDQEDATAPRSVTLPKADLPTRPQGQQQRPRAATPEQKRDLAILVGQKLGPDAARNRHAVMSQRFERAITSFDQLTFPEAATAIGELKKRADHVPPRDEELYEQLRADLRKADLDGIDKVSHAVADAHAARQITDADLQQLNELAHGLTQALIADAAGERDWPAYAPTEETVSA